MAKTKHGMTIGHTAVIFKTPGNDLGLEFKAVNRIIERLGKIDELPKNETAYQVALDDLRGTIRELSNPAWDVLWVSWIWWQILAVLILGWLPAGLASMDR